MRLGYLIPEFPSQTHIFFWREIRALRRLGEEVFLLSTKKPPISNCRHEFAAAAIAETHYVFPPSIVSLSAWIVGGFPGKTAVLAYLRRLHRSSFTERMGHYALLASAIDLVEWSKRHRIDHIHGHSFANSAHLLSMARRMGGPPYSLTLHGDLNVYGTDHKIKMMGAAVIFTVGEHLRKQVLELGVPANKVHNTFMGVETSQLSELGKDRIFRSGELKLTTVARLDPAKGHFHALAAVQRARQVGINVSYSIAGEGFYRDAIFARIKELGLASCVHLTGTLGETEVYQLLADSDAFVLTSVGGGEAWPVSVMEAMGAGLPTVVSKIGATSEMIKPGVDGILVQQRDETEIFNSIKLLANDVSLRRRIGEAARKTARQRFDVIATASTLRDTIQASLSQTYCTPTM